MSNPDADYAKHSMHIREMIQYHAFPAFMIALGVVGAVVVSFAPSESPIDHWLYVSLIETQGLLFWAFVAWAVLGVVFSANLESHRRMNA